MQNGIDKIDILMINCEGAEYGIFDQDGEFWQKLGIVIITLHTGWGTKEQLRQIRHRIYDRFINSGFEQLGGHEREEIDNADHNLEFFFQKLGYGRQA